MFRQPSQDYSDKKKTEKRDDSQARSAVFRSFEAFWSWTAAPAASHEPADRAWLLLVNQAVGGKTPSDKRPVRQTASFLLCPQGPSFPKMSACYLEGPPWAGRSRRSAGRRCTGSERCCRPGRCTAPWEGKHGGHVRLYVELKDYFHYLLICRSFSRLINQLFGP